MPSQIAELRKKVQETGPKLFTMETQERMNLFQGKEVNEELANFVNEKFEKALTTKRKGAIHKWLEDFTIGKKVLPKDIITKIANQIDNENVDEIVETAVREGMGITLSNEELSTINRLVKELTQIQKTGEMGLPTTEYMKKRMEIEEYMEMRNPDPFMTQFMSIWARAAMLASFKSPLLNIISNTAFTTSEAIVRMIVKGKVTGANPELISKYMGKAMEIYNATGFDISRVESVYDEALLLGERRVKATNKVFQYAENVVFKNLMGVPDVWFSALNFAHSLDINTTKAAEAEGYTGEALKQRARELFEKASNITDPQTLEVDVLRQASTYAAKVATGQNDDRWATQNILRVRKELDNAIPQLMLGTNIAPFVKTPVNFALAGIDHSPAGLILPMINALKGTKPTTVEEIEWYSHQLARAGLGILLGIIAGYLLPDDDDYIPDYAQATPEQRRNVQMGNGVYYGIKIGDTWVSLQYFGPAATTIAAIMQGRKTYKYSESESEAGKATDLTLGASKALWSPVTQFPVLSSFLGITELLGTENYSTTGDSKNEYAMDKLSDQIAGRLIPAIVSDVGVLTDDFDRRTRYDSLTDNFIRRIPYARETLDPKYSIYGEPIESKGVAGFLFGSRGSKVMNSPLLNEVTDLNKKGVDVTVLTTKMKPMTTAKKELSPKEYDQYLAGVQNEVRQRMEKVMTTEKYKKASDENKAIILENERNNAIIDYSNKNGYERFVKGYKGNDVGLIK